jgi:hypothetical protein
VHVERRRGRDSDGRVVRVAADGRPVLPHGPERPRRAWESLLATASLLTVMRRGDFYILLLLIAAALAGAIVGLLW